MFRVAIDVGHARRTGAVGNGYEEHEMCKKLALELKRALERFELDAFEADVIDFEHLSNDADLAATVKAVNAGNYDVCVCLHMDHDDSPQPHGAHVCYVSAKGKALATEIALRLCPQMPGRAEQVRRRAGLYVLRKTKPVAVLVECGFISNEGDAQWVYEHPEHVALSIALGVAAWCDGEFKQL
jgi:N-acetylmuramoyl-L-alanine amidase